MGHCRTRTLSNNNTKLLSLCEWSYYRYVRRNILTNCYYPLKLSKLININKSIFISVYDITKRSTFLSLQKWIEEVRRYTSSNVIVSLIGNKCDLPDQREVEPDEPKSFCRYVPEIMFVMETSAKDNTNVEDTFRSLATELKVKYFLNFKFLYFLSKVYCDDNNIYRHSMNKSINKSASHCILYTL